MMNTIRRTLCVVFILCAIGSWAQAPQKFNYQAVVRNVGGSVLANDNIDVQFSIRDQAISGTVLYEESHATTTNQFGIISLEVGGGTPLSGSFGTINWATNAKYLEVSVDTGSGFNSIGIPQLLSVPYALYSNQSGGALPAGTSGKTVRHNGSAWVADSNLFNNGNSVGIGTTGPTNRLQVYTNSDTCGIKVLNTRQSVGNYGILAETNANFSTQYGVYGKVNNNLDANNTGYAVYGFSNMNDAPSGTQADAYGGYFIANADDNSYGVRAQATSDNLGGGAWGVYGTTAGSSSVQYGVYCSGDGAYTGVWIDVSDMKFKRNIEDFDNALSRIMNLRPRIYEMKTDEYPFMNFSEGLEIGFIAQEMETVFPTLVVNGKHPGPEDKDSPEEYKGVNYIGLIPVLVSAMQEQQNLIEDLRQQIEVLNKKLDEHIK